MFCPQCGKANPDSAKFCRACGAPLATRDLRSRATSAEQKGEEKKTFGRMESQDIAKAQAPEESTLRCPNCGSTNVYVHKRGYYAGRGCCGALACGPLGLLLGQVGAQKIMKTCLNCNKSWY